MKRLLAVGMICWWVIGCGGGGGGGGDSSGGMPTEAERAQAFKDEAIRLAEANAVVMCQTVVCAIADSDVEETRNDGVVVNECHWNCLETAIDGSGETQNYIIFMFWERLPDGCFGPAEVLLAQEAPFLCVPNQERF